jgi:uncharacterized protein (UPF0332 family)
MKNEGTSELIRYRLGQAQTTLEDAKFLLDGKRSVQSIINRSYYAMFYAALALLQKIGKVPSKHAGVISLFDTEFALKGVFPKEFSRDFHKAFELRQVADYKVVEASSLEKAEETWNKAVRFVDAAEKYLVAEEIDGKE